MAVHFIYTIQLSNYVCNGLMVLHSSTENFNQIIIYTEYVVLHWYSTSLSSQLVLSPFNVIYCGHPLHLQAVNPHYSLPGSHQVI